MPLPNPTLVLDTPPLIPIAAAAEALHVHRRTLNREAERGRLRTIRVGVKRFVTEEIIREYLTPQ
jgi:excisionase family DNA binding protein